MRNITTINARAYLWPLRLVCLLAFLLTTIMAKGVNNHYYYKATVTSQGNGKVYISKTNNQPNNNEYKVDYMDITGDESNGESYATANLYLWVQPDDYYSFDHWERTVSGNKSGAQNFNREVVSLSGSNPFTDNVQYNGSENDKTQINYYAHFKPVTGLVNVSSEGNGTATIDNTESKVGDNVTLTAIPSGGSIFLGWTKDNGSSYVSTANPYSFTVSSRGTYKAHFSTVSDKVYVRLQNKSTGRFISFWGTGSPTGSITNTLTFGNSLKMIAAASAQGNPTTVFMKATHKDGLSSVGDDLTAHGISYSSLAGTHMLTLEKNGDAYRIKNGNSYLCDAGGDWLQMKTMSSADTSADWYVYTLDENTTQGAFGANTKAKYTKDGKYYTTMYADFAYQCMDGVKAYYLPLDEDTYDKEYQIVRFAEVPNGKVPANMAVVLECDNVQNDAATTPSDVTNRLRPLLPGAEGTPTEGSIISEGSHFLKGYVSVNGSTVANNNTTMYVLSYDNSLGFYKYSKSSMTPNKAYLDIDGTQEIVTNPSAVKYAFGRVNPSTTDPDDPSDNPSTDSKGDMNSDGKLTIADVMILVKKIVEE